MIASLGCGGAALAQTPAAAPSPVAADPDAGEIVVTAQRRTELARDVPISLTALSGEQLARGGAIDTVQLQTLTPGLKIDRIGNFTAPALRGITATVTGPAADTNVAIYLDGVYQPATTANTFDLPDVERVEILKGPQGTLFGRNATGGAIQVFTRAPSFETEGSATASYGNYDDFMVKGFVSTPIVADRIALSVAGYYHRNDSYYSNLRSDTKLQGEDTKLVRAKLRFAPTETLEIVLAGAYGNRKESAVLYGTPLNGNSIARLLDPNAIIPSRPFDVALSDEARRQRVRSYDLSGNLQLTLPAGKLTSITAYLVRDVGSGLDADYAFTPNGLGITYFTNSRDDYFSQELSYASSYEGPLNFVLGGFYTDGTGSWNPLRVSTPAFGVTIFGYQDVESVAGFGELYYDLSERISLIGGLRYSWERRVLEGTTLFALDAAKPATLPRVGSRSWDSVTPRASVRYELTPRSNVYFTYSRGFKSGLFNTNNVSSVDVADPEKIDSYEVGFKGRVGDMLILDTAAFYYDYRDLQATIITSVNGVPLSFLRNAASARVYGLELDASLRLSPQFDLRAAGSLLDAEYDDFANASVNQPCTTIAAPGGVCSTVGTPLNIGNATVPFDASGGRIIRAPKFTGTFTANGHFDVAGGRLDLVGTLYYSSRVDFTLDRRIRQPSYATLDARAAWTPEGTGLTVSVYGRNLTDKTIIAGNFVTELADGVSWAPPRTYGVQLDYRF